MPTTEPLSRSGITSLTGMSRDVLTFWIRQSLVRPIVAPAGTGRHLRFHWYEANIAALMLQFKQLGFNTEALLAVASIYRRAIAWAGATDLSPDQIRVIREYFSHTDWVERTSDRGNDYTVERYVAQQAARPGNLLTADLINVAKSLDRIAFSEHAETYLEIMQQPLELYESPDSTLFWPTAGGWQSEKNRNLGITEQRKDGYFATVAVDVDSLLYHVWNRA